MKISLIVAAAEDNAIGRDNQLLWQLPNDLRFFKNTTWGMPVIMGRKTFESMGAKPLPGRFNIVISRQDKYLPEAPVLQVASSLEMALQLARETHCREVFIAGGGQLYQQALPLAGRIYITRVKARFPDAEVYFPGFDEAQWKCLSSLDFHRDEKHAFDYAFQVWEKK